MTKEDFKNINNNFETDLKNLRAKIEAEIKAKYLWDETILDEKNRETRWYAEFAGYYESEKHKNKSKEDTEKAIEKKLRNFEAQIQTEIEAEYENESKRLEGIVFKEYGGSKEKAEQLVEKPEQSTKEFNKASERKTSDHFNNQVDPHLYKPKRMTAEESYGQFDNYSIEDSSQIDKTNAPEDQSSKEIDHSPKDDLNK